MKYPILVLQKVLFTLITTIIVISCASSTGSRYEDKDKTKTGDKSSAVEEKNLTLIPKEDFDITPYKTQIAVPEKKKYSGKENDNIWFDYGSAEIRTETKSLVGTAEGYRVLILTTDNSEEANQVKADIYFGKNANEVYVDFEPPFYKVKVGDFDSQKNADDLRFKLNQLGYKEAKVIKEKINIYK
ncbi:MAG: SPOR domain-containing protein [Ignavibacteria bacterium]|nr:SPOR domain-containing protein [Ignavibacteria bacterium]